MEQPTSEERTFKQYNPAQAKAYAANRGTYHEKIYNIILDYHRTTGGSLHTLLDVGCGPGNATRPMARHFGTAYGLDPSPEMINTAKQISADSGVAETSGGGKIEFVEGRAEDLGFLFDNGRKVDLLMSAMAVCASIF